MSLPTLPAGVLYPLDRQLGSSLDHLSVACGLFRVLPSISAAQQLGFT